MRSLTVLLLGAALSTGVAAQSSDDGRITDEVRRRLAGDPDVKCGACEVDTVNGIVTIRGTVDKEKFRAKAEKLAKKVKGVKGITNELKVKNPL
ncbi:MAG: BON domain-containing protein [Bryobacteraceae bacterium]|nr:BON domain-containing protein [Bryobacteraceae bacterium]